MKDLFEYYDEQPTNLKAITSEMEQNVDGFDYPTLEEFKERCEAIGYTFDYDLSAEPFNLRKFDPNELTVWELKKLHTICGAYIRDNEFKKKYRTRGMADIEEIKQKLFNQFERTL
tara:strand:- start:278 stop:625 length:348 start_codon:yes stop_codon:yes gene_type:complete